jgi:hypothetical protein
MKDRRITATTLGLCMRLVRHATIAFAFVVGGLYLIPTTVLATAGDAPCPSPSYSAGFMELHSVLGDAMGAPDSCEYADPNGTGDVLQRTTRGLAFWRSETNTPSFTTGRDHWALTENGPVYWSGFNAEPPANAQVVDQAPPAPVVGVSSPTLIPSVQPVPSKPAPRLSPLAVAQAQYDQHFAAYAAVCLVDPLVTRRPDVAYCVRLLTPLNLEKVYLNRLKLEREAQVQGWTLP